nr:Chain C, LEU-LEU-TRP-ASN-GLY-PRO-ILE-ALA-VAL [Yellow fever virus]6SS8_F Chain F, LEU-LEU-TRP-ASN-GLY-PRO-ILE-ALA-VAL [Yellow fever virus]
LLWNGPIAV